jgi:outer membrane protein OmpA-like peptidoglycan-associated protein
VEYPDTDVLIVGHTDSVGSNEYNMELSKKRAYSVTNYFIHEKKLISSRFNTNWFGEEQPMHDNNTAEGRAKNRRVNIVIVPNEKMEREAQEKAGN